MQFSLSDVFLLLFMIGATNALNKKPVLIEAYDSNEASNLQTSETCQKCETVVDDIIFHRRNNATRNEMIDYLYQLCLKWTSWGATACYGRTQLETDTILFIIDHRKDLTGTRFCSIYFQDYKCEDPNADDWTIPLPARPAVVKPIVKNPTENLHILQITDPHMDSLYQPGSNSKCSNALCCEIDSGEPANEEDAAGYWGNYGLCNMPWHTLDNMMTRITTTHNNIDLIYFTGDMASHRSWTSSIKVITETNKQFHSSLASAFPNKIIYPILGNHDSHPADFYSLQTIEKSTNVSSQWLYDLSAEEWSRWLPNSTLSTIKKGGFYTVLVKPGFRIIALNSNVCYDRNIWLILENKDTYGQLEWLVNTLEEAERNGEKVHILSHIPSSDLYSSCVKVWSREFTKIVIRFSDTISAIFNGHTHLDEFKLYYNDSAALDQVKTVAYNGASFVTFLGSNANYRMYEVDNTNLTVTDYSEYTFNLTAANYRNNAPSWYELYSFKKAYDLPDLTYGSLDGLYKKLTSNNSDNEWIEKYFRYMYRDSEVKTANGCDSSCKKALLCRITAVETADGIDC